MRVDLPLDKKTVENQDWTGLGHRAAGSPGRGPLGLRAVGPSRAVGRGPLAAGVLLAKPVSLHTYPQTIKKLL